MWRTLESKSGSYAGQDGAAGDAEDDVDAERLERADQRLGAGEGLLGADGDRLGGAAGVGPQLAGRPRSRAAVGSVGRALGRGSRHSSWFALSRGAGSQEQKRSRASKKAPRATWHGG